MKIYTLFAYIFFILVFSTLSYAKNDGFTVYISPNGNDKYNGFSAKIIKGQGPVKTLNQARNIVRKIRFKNPNLAKPIYVRLLAGTYRLDQPFVLDAIDSGTTISPTIYQADQPNTVTISGAIPLEPNGWKSTNKCTGCIAYQQIKSYQLSGHIREASGILFPDGLGGSNNIGRSELYYNHEKMTLARWPNNDYARIESTLSETDLLFSAPEKLPTGINIDEPMWARGYWARDWADLSRRIVTVIPISGMLRLEEPIIPYGVSKKGRFFLFSALDLLDKAGEWHYSEKTGKIYFWPDRVIEKSDIEWSLAENLLIANNVSNVFLKNIEFTKTRGTTLVLKNVDNFRVSNCEVNGSNGWAIQMTGKNSGVYNSHLKQLGQGGVSLSGGNRNLLEKSRLTAENNIISHYAQRVRTYQPALQLSGIGVIARGNEISYAPHVAIMMNGNEHIIENNTISNVLMETSDAGAIYMGRDWTARGNIIRGNYLYNITSNDKRYLMGVYLDDQASGTTIEGNIFWNVSRPVFIGGGSDNIVTDNVFINSSPAIYLDDRGLEWQKIMTLDPKGELQTRLNAVPYKSQKWIKEYAGLSRIIEDGLGVPHRNKFTENYFINSEPYEITLKPTIRGFQSIDSDVKVIKDLLSYPTSAPALGGICNYVEKLVNDSDYCDFHKKKVGFTGLQ